MAIDGQMMDASPGVFHEIFNVRADAISDAVSEDAILACVDRHFENTRMPLGRGDDCAILRVDSELCVSTDLFLEDVHFRRAYFTPAEIGHKALAVNVSDIAAMGAKPAGFQLALGLPDWTGMAFLDEFFAGMAALANTYEISLTGGDLSLSPYLHIGVTIFGESQDKRPFLKRGGSMPGDRIFVIGKLGLARVGLDRLEFCGRDALSEWPEACAAHLTPKPQVAAGLTLARAGQHARPPALIDVSDGLLRDLGRLLGSSKHGNLGARLSVPESAIHGEVLRFCLEQGLDPCVEVCLGGEDYALLGSCAPDMSGALRAAMPDLTFIGEVINGWGIICNDRDLTELTGFDHFANHERPR